MLVEKCTMYKCKYCNELHPTEREAVDCLDSHDIIFCLEEYISNHDCWGRSDGDWKLDDSKFYKNYKDAIKDKSSNTRITYKNL